MNEYRLVVCEKPSVARSIAAVLGAGKRGDGFLSGGGYLVSWCFGHLAELSDADAYDEKFGKWRREDLPILPDSWQYTVARDKQKQMNTLRTLMHREDVCEVVNACDAGREGELIFRLVYDFTGVVSVADLCCRCVSVRLLPGDGFVRHQADPDVERKVYPYAWGDGHPQGFGGVAIHGFSGVALRDVDRVCATSIYAECFFGGTGGPDAGS